MTKQFRILFAVAFLLSCGFVVALILPGNPQMTAEFIRYDTNNRAVIRFVNNSNQRMVCLWETQFADKRGCDGIEIEAGSTRGCDCSVREPWKVGGPLLFD